MVRSKLNKFDHVWGRGPCTVRFKVNKFELDSGLGPCVEGRRNGVLYRVPLP